ncbi:ABC transporter substrate-binding protein [Leptolyngbya sp. PCC 6406]|uniref:ABC transporter substrate-binding protein n=1 Tax=Leptolyngbya sp. PCC 6406 TaxID=1173264 RepID=UPI00055C7D52|nr:ABC transporter substrate-binding protein [Leptolyngbya sp. PCC 6406]
MARSPSGGKEVLVLGVSLLVTVGLLAGGAYWMRDSIRGYFGGGTPTAGNGSNPADGQGSRLSRGERSLVPNPSAAKVAGITAYGQGDYASAVTALEAALGENRNDPETLIYLNNARIGNQRAYTLAVAAPISPALDPAQEILRGAAQAQDEINQAGGIQGIPLKLVIADDGDDPDIAQAVAAALGADSEVLGVIGHFSSGVTLAAEPSYSQAQLPLISPTSTSLELSGRSPYLLRTTPSDRFTAAALTRYMLNDLGENQAAVFYNGESNYSVSLKNEFTTATFSDGGAVVSEFDVANSSFNATEAVTQAIDRGAAVLMLATNTGTLDQAVAIIQANQGRLILLGGDSLYNPRILEQGQANAVGMVVAIPWHILAHSQSPFAQASRSLWGGDVNWRTATTYDAIAAFIAALQTAPNPTRESLQQALTSANFQAEGATDPVRFLPSGDRNQAAQVVTIVPGNRSGFGYDYEPVPATSQ